MSCRQPVLLSPCPLSPLSRSSDLWSQGSSDQPWALLALLCWDTSHHRSEMAKAFLPHEELEQIPQMLSSLLPASPNDQLAVIFHVGFSSSRFSQVEQKSHWLGHSLSSCPCGNLWKFCVALRSWCRRKRWGERMEKMRETTIVGMRLRKDMAKSANTLLLLFSEMLWISSRSGLLGYHDME